MKKTFLFLLSIATATAIRAQHVVVGLDKMNVAYIGVDNPMSIASDIYGCDQMVVKEDGKVLEGKNCQYNLRPTLIGKITIEIFGKHGEELIKIGNEEIRVQRIPDFAVTVVGRKLDGTISSSKLSTCYGPICGRAFDYQLTVTITSFSITMFRSGNGGILFQKTTQGDQFDEETRKIFRQLKDNDVVELSNIRANGPQGSKNLQNLRLTILN